MDKELPKVTVSLESFMVVIFVSKENFQCLDSNFICYIREGLKIQVRPGD